MKRFAAIGALALLLLGSATLRSSAQTAARPIGQSAGRQQEEPRQSVRQRDAQQRDTRQREAQQREAQLRARLDSIARPPKAAGHEAMRFEQERIEAGTIAERAEPPAYRFVWRNEGATPLVVTRVTTSCGCLTVDFDRRPVAAGETGSLTATYHPRRRPGRFDRRIFVYTQLSEQLPTAILSLAGDVIPDADRSEEYPVALGTLRLRRGEVRFAGDRVQVERIACYNAGGEPCTLRADSLLTPPCITLTGDPERLEAGAEGDLVIRFDPSKLPEHHPARLRLVLAGEGLPPLRHSVTLLFGDADAND